MNKLKTFLYGPVIAKTTPVENARSQFMTTPEKIRRQLYKAFYLVNPKPGWEIKRDCRAICYTLGRLNNYKWPFIPIKKSLGR